jgi:2'-5' RNA ligase
VSGEGGSPEVVRTFVAFSIPPALQDGISGLVRELGPRVADLRWVRPEGIHLTLRFLGPTRSEQIRTLGPALAQCAAACPRSEAQVGGLGVFPARGSPRVLWLGVSLPAPVLALQVACEEAAVAAGFPGETRPFRSHLTLGRWRVRTRAPDLPSADLGPLLLQTLVLYRSELLREGARYTPLASFDLGA